MRKAHRKLESDINLNNLSPHKVIQSLCPALPMKGNIVVPIELEME